MTITWIAVAAVAVLVAIVATSAGARGTRTPEPELTSHADAVTHFNIRRLSLDERAGFRNQWRRIEAQFIQRPAIAVIDADEFISGIMHARGYPISEFEENAAALSAKHPRVVELYRKGHSVMESRGRGQISTEGLRQAMLQYRALFDELVNEGVDVETSIPIAHEVTPRPIVRQPAPDEYPEPPSEEIRS